MKICPRCGKQYEDDQAYCSADGGSLSGSNRTPSTSDAGALKSGTMVGGYRVLNVVGRGGMGIVYAAEHARLGKKVAVKVLRDTLVEQDAQVERFFGEARAANQVAHENIIEVHDFIEDGPYRAYVMELLEGHTLSKDLSAGKPMPLARVANIGRQIADGLTAVHAAGIIHRDLKPDNVFITSRQKKNDFVKLLDFGVAKNTQSKGDPLTQVGMVLGTPAYMAPEQVQGHEIDPRVDVYSLGVILYQMTSGQRPFKGKSVPDLMMKQVMEAPPPFSTYEDLRVNPSLEKLIFQCLEKDRELRPAGMGEVEQRLSAIGEMLARGGTISGSYPLPLSVAPAMRSTSGPLPATLRDLTPAPSTASVPAAAGEEDDAAKAAAAARDIAFPLPEPAPLASAGPPPERAPLEIDVLAGSGPVDMISDVEDQQLSGIATKLEGTRSNRPLIAAGLAVTVLAGAALVVMSRQSGDASVADGGAAAADERAPEKAQVGKIAVHVESTPPGAEIRLGDEVLGRTPADLSLDPAAAGRSIELSLDGHEAGSGVVPAADGAVTVALALIKKSAVDAPPPASAVDDDDDDAAKAVKAATPKPAKAAPPAGDVRPAPPKKKPPPPPRPDRAEKKPPPKRPLDTPIDPFR